MNKVSETLVKKIFVKRLCGCVRWAWVSLCAVLISACSTNDQLYNGGKPTFTVCAEITSVGHTQLKGQENICDFVGASGLQFAFANAPNDSTIIVRPGIYQASSFTDTPFQDVAIRAFLKVDHKRLKITFEDGAVLRPNPEFASSAMVAVDSELEISGLRIEDFKYGEAEDNFYDGHGLFVIGGKVSLSNATISNIQKMALTGREAAILEVQNLSILDSHLGVWLEEEAKLTLTDSKILNSESAGIAAYDSAVSIVEGGLIQGNQDDGLYTEGSARIEAYRLQLVNNAPFAARAADSSKISLTHASLHSNESDIGEENEGIVLVK